MCCAGSHSLTVITCGLAARGSRYSHSAPVSPRTPPPNAICWVSHSRRELTWALKAATHSAQARAVAAANEGHRKFIMQLVFLLRFLSACLLGCGLVVAVESVSGVVGSVLSPANQQHAVHQREELDAPPGLPADLKDAVHGVKMGISAIECDNGEVNTTMDWDGSPAVHTCFQDLPFPVRTDVPPVVEFVELPNTSISQHVCMDKILQYNHTEPVFGNHRPLWPVFGEYTFIPPQRWLHTLEHGGVVMLYHPCSDPEEVEKLRQLVRGCLRKHVITAHPTLSQERPLALLAHQYRFYMATVDDAAVRTFIRERALHGREGHEVREGQFSQMLEVQAEPPQGSDIWDSVLCPNQ